MFRIRTKDLALVAFAGGLLAFELVGLRAAAPAVLSTLAGVSGWRSMRTASREAHAATESMVNGFSVAAAQAAVGVVEGAARQAAAVAPVTVRRTLAPSRQCPAFGYVLVVGDGHGATQQAHLRLVTWRAGACRAKVRAITAQQRADVARRAIEVTSEASAL